MERILIVRLGAMGDVIHALPAATALRDSYPDARIDWVIEERWCELLCATPDAALEPRSRRKPVVDRVHLADTKKWRANLFSRGTWREAVSLRQCLKEPPYDAVLDFQGTVKSAVIARLSGAKRRIGFSEPRERPAKWFYSEGVTSRAAHVIDKNMELGSNFEVGLATTPRPALPRSSTSEQRVSELLGAGNKERFAVLTPCAGWRAKEWPAERYGAVARELGRDGIASLINIGPGVYEAEVAGVVERASKGAARRVQCSISDLIALARQASLLIGGDSGPMHLANALGVPVVAIFGPTDPARNGPYFGPHTTLRDPNSRTTYSHRRTIDPGIVNTTIDHVLEAARSLLAR